MSETTTGDLAVTRDRLTELLDRLTSLDYLTDHLIVSTCLSRHGRPIVRFDVSRTDDDGIIRIYRTDIGLDTYRQ